MHALLLEQGNSRNTDKTIKHLKKKEGMGKWEGNDIFVNSFFPLYILKILIPHYNPGLNK